MFAVAEVAAMRDRTRSRRYSPQREEFRREHERRRAWGLVRRHAERLRRVRDRPADPRPADPQPAGHLPADSWRADSQPVSQPAILELAGSTRADPRPAGRRLTSPGPASIRPAASRPSGPRAAPSAASRPSLSAASRSVGLRLARPVAYRPPGTGPVVAGSGALPPPGLRPASSRFAHTKPPDERAATVRMRRSPHAVVPCGGVRHGVERLTDRWIGNGQRVSGCGERRLVRMTFVWGRWLGWALSGRVRFR